MPTNGLVASDTINFSEEFKNITGTTVGDNRALDVNVIATVGGGGGAEVPVPKARAVCSVCQTEFIKEVQVINLDEIDS